MDRGAEEVVGDRDYFQNRWMQQEDRGLGSAGAAGLVRDLGLGYPHPHSPMAGERSGGRGWRN